MAGKHSLHTFVHRTLVYRLVTVGVILSFILGLVALFVERDRVSDEAIDIAINRLQIFSFSHSDLLDELDSQKSETINLAVKEFRESQIQHKIGSYVFVGDYDVNGKAITEIFDKQQQNVGTLQQLHQEMGLMMPGESNEQHEIVRVVGLPYLRVALPIVDSSQKTVGVLNSFFAYSDETIHSFRSRGLRAMFSAFAIVLLTTAVLYPVILRLTRRITQFSVQLLDANLDTLETLGSAIAQRDSDTNAHNYRVTIYAVRIGEELNLPNQTMRTLIKGAFLHDIGKIGIPDEILWKPGKLNDEEFEIMKTHVEQGREIIQRSAWLRDAMEVVLSHHEKMTGKGYPGCLAGEGIPITARIFSIADVFDALTSKRPYKEAWSFEAAMETLEEGSGSHFDPLLLEAFNRIAKPLYDKYGGKEEVFQEELRDIIRQYFHEGMNGLEY